MDLDDAQPQHIIDWLENSPDKDLAAGKTLRFRGMCLMLIGRLYPRAKIRVHRLGCPADSDFMTKGTTLYKMRSAFDMKAIYRITMIECDAGDERDFVWSQNNAGQGYSADEYCNLLELGADQLGHLMMFSICREGIQCWYVSVCLRSKVTKANPVSSYLQEPHSSETRKGLHLPGVRRPTRGARMVPWRAARFRQQGLDER